MSQPVMPLDLQTQQAGLDQKKALLQALLQQGTRAPQGQMVSGHYVAPSAIASLAPLLSLYAGKRGMDNLQSQQAVLSQQYNSRLSEGLKQYLGNNQRGQTLGEGQVADLLQNDVDPGPLAEPSRDPRTAAATAITSGIPELAQVGMEDLKAMAAGMRKSSEPETFAHQPVAGLDTTGKLAFLLTGNRGGVKTVPGFTPPAENLVVNNQVVDKNNPSQVRADYNESFGQPFQIGADWFQKDSRGKVYKLDQAPKVSISNNPTINGQKAGMSEWSKLAAQTVSDLATEARSSVKLLGTLNQLESSGQAGVFTGPAANAATFFSGLGRTLGFPVDVNKLANSQTFEAASISAWQDMVKAAGGNRGVVKEESERIARMVPQLAQSPEGRQQLTAYLRQLASQNVRDAQQAQKEYSSALQADNPGAFTFGLGSAQLPRDTPLPPASGAASTSGASPMSLDDYIKLHSR